MTAVDLDDNDPRITTVLNQISAALTTPKLSELNRQIAEMARPDSAKVAGDWLTSIGIVPSS